MDIGFSQFLPNRIILIYQPIEIIMKKNRAIWLKQSVNPEQAFHRIRCMSATFYGIFCRYIVEMGLGVPLASS